jgi:glucose-1-phosphate thymidylyltransferase
VKGIILAGGAGTRLHPVTQVLSKQLLPVYDKPMIYYPLSVLMLAGVTDILVITTPEDQRSFQRMLGSGSDYGLNIAFACQAQPNGLAEAFIIGREFVGDDSVALVLGDNLFYGPGFSDLLRRAVRDNAGCTLFGYRAKDPQRYGVAEVDAQGTIVSLVEKPQQPRSDLAITGLYLYDNDVLDIAASVQPSHRGELEITDVNSAYLRQGRAKLIDLGRGFAWLDTGTHDSLLEAGQFVRMLENRTGVRIACIEEIALRMGYIDAQHCHALGEKLSKSSYGQYLMSVAESMAPAD